MSTLESGASVAGFRLERPIGEGATGRVFLANSKTHGRVALKVLNPELALDERFRNRFLRETKVAAELDHPRIVSVVGAGEEDGVLYLAMRFIDGVDLRTFLKREGRLERGRAVDVLSQVAEALDSAHAAGLVHRDVKPANILLEGEDAFICDFGLARHISSVSSLTSERGFVGTIDYIAPEQIEGGAVDRRADVYSLACVLFECLSQRRPFVRESDVATVFAHLNEPPPSLSEVRPDLPLEFDAVFTTALAKSPGERYSSCGELAAAARAAEEGRAFRRRRPGRRSVMIAIATVLAAVGALWGVLGIGEGPAHASAKISQTSIAGARLGLEPVTYKRLFGPKPLGGTDSMTNFSYLTWYSWGVAVYFGKAGGGEVIDTWNKAFRTAAGVGPCTSLARLKEVYGHALKPSPNNIIHGKAYAYTLGSHLIFGFGDTPPASPTDVSSVVLDYGPPSQDGWAGYLAISGQGNSSCG